MPREILVDWTTASGSDHRSVMMFGQVSTVADQRLALDTFLDAIKGPLDNGTSYVIETSGRELDDTTGALTGVWSESTPYTGGGAAVGEAVADATQGLFRWRTNNVVGSRMLQGRTFIPGLGAVGLQNGGMNTSVSATWITAGNAFIAAAVQFGVWHRPVLGAGGAFWAAESCDVWAELAVLRRRR